MEEMIDEIKKIYYFEMNSPFPYENFRQLQNDFSEEFKRYAPKEIITADFNTYMMFIYGLSSGGIIKQTEDPLGRFKIKEWLNKSFFEWFPKYRFLEQYDLSHYEELHKSWSVIEKLRLKLIGLIRHYEG